MGLIYTTKEQDCMLMEAENCTLIQDLVDCCGELDQQLDAALIKVEGLEKDIADFEEAITELEGKQVTGGE